MLGRGYEYMDLEPETDTTADGEGDTAQVAASDRGAGVFGFTGTVTQEAAQAAGLTTLAGDSLGGGPWLPMLPGTWQRPDGHDNT